MMAFIPRNLIQIRKAEKVSTSEQNIITKPQEVTRNK